MKTSTPIRSCAILAIAAGFAICNGQAQTVDTTTSKTTVTTAEPAHPLDHKEEKELRKAKKHEDRAERHAAEHGDVLPGAAVASKTTTTTTTSEGTINSFTPQQFVIQSSSGPVTYRYSKTTQYVDDSGAPVSVEIVKSGAPVTVSYIHEGDGFVAQRVIVHTRH